MSIVKLSVLSIFLLGISGKMVAQNDTLQKEKKIDGVIIRGNDKKSETANLLDQKKSTVIKQGVSAEEISRKGVSNVEQGLTKITGITTVEGRGLFVRGLEERYNYLLINGLGSPSNNPFQKIIALKQFPTDVVGKLNIYKTFNSNLYGDFAGATFDIETLTIDKCFSKVEFGIGINTLSTFRDNFKISESASNFEGYLGVNDKDSRLPNVIRNVRPDNYNFGTEGSLKDFKNTWNVDRVKTPPNTSIGFTTVQKLKIGETANLGFLFSLNHGNKYEYKEGSNNQFRPNDNIDIVNMNFLKRKQYNYQSESSVLLGLVFKNKNTNLNFNTIFLQNTNNIIEDNYGYKDNQVQNKEYGFFRTNQLDVSRFLDLQLIGSQKINERHLLKAGASYVINNYSQPDRKIIEGSRLNPETNNSQLPDGLIYMKYGGNNLIRQYLDVDSRFYGSAFAEYQLSLGEKSDDNNYPWQIAVGYNSFSDFRKTTYRFIFGRQGNNTPNNPFVVDIDNPQSVFENSIKNGELYYQEGSDVSQFYNSFYQIVNGTYANINYKPNTGWDILFGARYENDLTLIRYSKQDADHKENLDKTRNFFLPSLSIKKVINPKNNLRFSFSKTVTRPILIETMPIKYVSPDNVNIIGNQNIVTSDNYNMDLKWEYYPTNKELIAVNLFAKRINNAIEKSLTASADATGTTITFFNSKKAEILGIELEGIIRLERLAESLEKFTLGANATFMYSNVERSQDQLNIEKPNWISVDELRKRGLQGAAPYTINADLKYEYKSAENFAKTISLVYNVSGSKIFATGGSGTDNYYEKPFHQLDFIYQNQLNRNWNIKLSIQNIFNSQYKIIIGDQSYAPLNTEQNSNSMTDYYRGISFNTTIGYTF